MTQEWMVKTLIDLGFKEKDAEVYVFLAFNGPKGVRDIADSMKTYKRKVYRILKKLQNNEIVHATFDLPAQFSVVSFDKLLDLLISDTLEEANCIEEKKGEILALWRSSVKGLKPLS
jgi:sugar-specific transcriptional regulator TrmB